MLRFRVTLTPGQWTESTWECDDHRRLNLWRSWSGSET
jgi:hypothetical protein